jgi:hypothetical protein
VTESRFATQALFADSFRQEAMKERRLHHEQHPQSGYRVILGTTRKYGLDPYWRDEKEWLCTVEFFAP